jgi:hypothetical protein
MASNENLLNSLPFSLVRIIQNTKTTESWGGGRRVWKRVWWNPHPRTYRWMWSLYRGRSYAGLKCMNRSRGSQREAEYISVCSSDSRLVWPSDKVLNTVPLCMHAVERIGSQAADRKAKIFQSYGFSSALCNTNWRTWILKYRRCPTFDLPPGRSLLQHANGGWSAHAQEPKLRMVPLFLFWSVYYDAVFWCQFTFY